jgi:hypothetical protein
MLIDYTITILLIVAIVLLIISLVVFITSKHLQRVAKRKAAERYRGKGALLPVANIYAKPPTTKVQMMQHPDFKFDDSFRKSFYQFPSSSTSSRLSVPEIRITFPEEDIPLQTPTGQRMSRVVVVQVGESGAAYVTAPPPYEGHQNPDVSAAGGLKEKEKEKEKRVAFIN